MDVGISGQVAWFLSKLPSFAALRRASAPSHPQYLHLLNPVPVSVLKIHSCPWGMTEPLATAAECRVQVYWQTMPGEPEEAVDDQFRRWLESAAGERPDLFPAPPVVEFPIRWLPGAAIPADHELVTSLARAVADSLGAPPPVEGIEGPCDLFVFAQEFGIPTVLWGPRGGNTHGADEYVEIESVVAAAKALLLFVHRWCA